jgi:tetratricopeptide (TPR) repeat protein
MSFLKRLFGKGASPQQAAPAPARTKELKSFDDVKSEFNRLRAEGFPDEALKLAHFFLDFMRKGNPQELRTPALILGWIAEVHVEKRQYAEAVKASEEAIELKRRVHGDQHPSYALGLSNLGSICKLMGDLRRMEELQTQALAIYRGLGAAAPPEQIGGVLWNCGLNAAAKKNYDQAVSLIQEAIACMQKVNPQHPMLPTMRIGLRKAESHDDMPHVIVA